MTKPVLAQNWSESKEDGRAYKHPTTGVRVPSVTTVIGMANKDGLSQYAADRTAKWCSENASLLLSKSNDDAIRGARYRWKDHADERAYVGDEVHSWIETWSEDGFAYPQLEYDAQQCVDRFLDFVSEHTFAPLFTEVTVWSDTWGYAGTFDWIAYLDGKLTMGDNKTSRKLHDENRMQLAALMNADYMLVLQEDGTYTQESIPAVERLTFLHLRPDDYDELYKRSDLSFYALEHVDLVEAEIHFKKFVGYLDVWNANQELKLFRKQSKVEASSW